MRIRKKMFQRRNSSYQGPEEGRHLTCLRERGPFLSSEQCEPRDVISR